MSSNLLLLLGTNFYTLNPILQEAVYRDCYHFLYRPILYIVQDHRAVEDIIQETFLKTINNAPDFANEAHLRSWMRVAARNESINYLRKIKKNRNDVQLENVSIHSNAYTAAAEESIEAIHEAKELEVLIQNHLHEMPPEARMLIELKWRKQLSYREIAEQLDTTEDTVRYKLHRARAVLKKKLRMYWRDGR
ncbi:RNA polymerase sigma factor [Paenibacillus sp. GCM10023252]|uniref:RNA polymerase sigma factor n=1 Tax=Paenibacillus sp. GCM10023252 TaxID=3252649 RepID=UPI00360E94A0